MKITADVLMIEYNNYNEIPYPSKEVYVRKIVHYRDGKKPRVTLLNRRLK